MVLAIFHAPQPPLDASAQLWPLAPAHLLLQDSCASDHYPFSLRFVLFFRLPFSMLRDKALIDHDLRLP